MIDVVWPDNEDCPDCGGFIFRPGPCAGVCQNVECVGCGSRFNVVRLQRHHVSAVRTVAPGRMPIVWAQRIEREDEGGGVWREDLFPRVLQ
jgi:hypothetical protein